MTNLFVAAAILIIAAIVFLVIAFKKGRVWLFILSCLVLSLSVVLVGEACDFYQETKTMRNEYTVYIDGVEVDKTKIDLSQYRLTFNEEEHEVYATSK